MDDRGLRSGALICALALPGGRWKIVAMKTALLIALLCAGCITGWRQNVESYISQHPATPASQARAMRAHHIWVGMTKEQLIAMMGTPDRINSYGGTYGNMEQYVYLDNYVYLTQDIVISWSLTNYP